MEDSGPASQPGAALANLHLDEVTGERVSKSELKKRQKMRALEEKKREKAATAPPKTEKRVSAEEEENNLTPNVSPLCWLWLNEPKGPGFSNTR
jgi:lysyl-tRNA synthetase class 2